MEKTELLVTVGKLIKEEGLYAYRTFQVAPFMIEKRVSVPWVKLEPWPEMKIVAHFIGLESMIDFDGESLHGKKVTAFIDITGKDDLALLEELEWDGHKAILNAEVMNSLPP